MQDGRAFFKEHAPNYFASVRACHLPCISPASPLHLPCISSTSVRDSAASAQVRALDVEFGRVLSALDAAPRPRPRVTVFLSDHGELTHSRCYRLRLCVHVLGVDGLQITSAAPTDRPRTIKRLAPYLAGMMLGEHAMRSKGLPYEESARIPLILRVHEPEPQRPSSRRPPAIAGKVQRRFREGTGKVQRPSSRRPPAGSGAHEAAAPNRSLRHARRADLADLAELAELADLAERPVRWEGAVSIADLTPTLLGIAGIPLSALCIEGCAWRESLNPTISIGASAPTAPNRKQNHDLQLLRSTPDRRRYTLFHPSDTLPYPAPGHSPKSPHNPLQASSRSSPYLTLPLALTVAYPHSKVL